MTTHSRGLRGDYSPGRGDITGNKYLADLDEADERQEAITHTTNALREDPLVVVRGRGGQSWAVPRGAYDAILEVGARR